MKTFKAADDRVSVTIHVEKFGTKDMFISQVSWKEKGARNSTTLASLLGRNAYDRALRDFKLAKESDPSSTLLELLKEALAKVERAYSKQV